ncbi:TetR-like C-terminal domain-containing protein [Promicromonospora citrea]|uniref:TetR family transcriptional regulator n=1 Tax=Promicromonospora citrea TaxID=43677 RepID=A0A8H9GHB4_9MICO|nr:TetR-like C-terminal domain-containing protein [Promicromonospora citrea]NNH51376.1 TetR/AcrR family transcriptional regulator C-terminal ligand-binding domain-containing protein [Promicromonospora citrea]GGM22853.1 TetR family transcriptional regulator [Promicromonospora citrea]
MATTVASRSSRAVRPGGRSARVRAAVHGAALELAAEGAAEALTIPTIAQRAGVHPTTVYRRWGTVAELLADVSASRFAGDLVVPDTGDLRADLDRYAAGLAKDLTDPDTLALVRATVGIGGEQGAAVCRSERENQLVAILERDRARGNEPPGIEETTDAILAPLYYRAVFTNFPLDPAWVHGLVERLLADQTSS